MDPWKILWELNEAMEREVVNLQEEADQHAIGKMEAVYLREAANRLQRLLDLLNERLDIDRSGQ